ncbi:di-heme-cytochrome C peroxidase [Sphingomonas sediminicola]
MLTSTACVWSRASADEDLGQGWSQADRDLWYEQSQGSRLLPYTWAKALETANGTEKFFDPANMGRFGYLPPEPTSLSRLPVGFAIDRQKGDGFTYSDLQWFEGQRNDEAWLGMNCSACHTAELQLPEKTRDGSAAWKRIRVDGGPTLADFQSMIEALDAALHSTNDDAAKFERFAASVLPRRDDPALARADRDSLRRALTKLIAWQDRVALANHGGAATRQEPQFGNGRLDAFGHIYNKVALFVGAQNQILNPSTAPTSYPFIWNTSQSDRVQWNGIASNQRLGPEGHSFDYGALGRNSGEVTGVFGDVALRSGGGAGGYRSSVQVQRLSELERLLGRLRPPPWPLKPIDTGAGSLWAAGQKLFSQRCASCHAPLAADDLKTRFEAKMSLFRPGIAGNTPPGTDIWMACNAYTYQIRTGVLQGTKRDVISGAPLAEVEPTSRVLETVVKGELAGQKRELVAAAVKAIFNSAPAARPVPPTGAFVEPGRDRARRRQICMTADSPILGYKARPLTGIWATAPYLHNGSVPTLYDLLLPEKLRPSEFYVGSRRFDPEKVGYVTAKAPDNPFKFVTHSTPDEAVPGNGNEGHDYDNASLKEPERWALIEYLKSL